MTSSEQFSTNLVIKNSHISHASSVTYCADLAVTTDYRQILSELLSKRLGNLNIENVFPGFSNIYNPLGIYRE